MKKKRCCHIKQGCLILALFFLGGCVSGGKNIQPHINALVVANQTQKAIQLLDEGPKAYGHRNELLFWLDRGMTFHLGGRYKESSDAFIKARRLVDHLYGSSSFEIASGWIANDNLRLYRGDDYEYILINIFQALNFMMMGDVDEALVEARDLDKQLRLIGSRYTQDMTHVYRDDAFAWALMGLLWEIEGSVESNNDAYIAYQRALEIYQQQYITNYQVQVPLFLKENLLRTAKRMGTKEALLWEEKFGIDVKKSNVKNEGELYVIQYAGYIPVKSAKTFIIPLGLTRITKISLPDFHDRMSETVSSMVFAQSQGNIHKEPAIVVSPIGQIAKNVMKSRIAWLTTKAVVRPASKAILEFAAENAVRQKYGQWQASAVSILGSIYNLSSEEADTRSWQTLPNDIRLAKLILPVGHWNISVEDTDNALQKIETHLLGVVNIKAGEKKILILRSFK